MTAYLGWRSVQYRRGLPVSAGVPTRLATARCPDQTIVAVLVRLALFPCDADNRRGRKLPGVPGCLGTAQRRACYCVCCSSHNSVEREEGVGSRWDQTSRHIEPLRSWPRARLANHLSPGGCASTQSPTSCISPQRPSQDEPAVEGQSCSGEWLALAPLISQSSPSRVSIRPASGQLAAARQQTNAGIDADAVAAPTLVSWANTLGRARGRPNY